MARWFRFRSREKVDQEVAREIRGHLELEAEEQRDSGATAREAEYAARRAFGNVSQAQEASGDVWLFTGIERLLQDLRYSFRTMSKSPLYTVVAVLTLALGIGANTAIFSVVNGVLLKPLAYRDPDRLVTILDGGYNPIAPATFLDWQRDSRSFDGMIAACAWGATLTGGEHAEQIGGMMVSDGTFELLGAAPLVGRTPSRDEYLPGRANVVVLSYPLWQQRFGGDPGIVGRPITLSGESYTVVGVMPPYFRFAPFWMTTAQMWVPFTTADKVSDREGKALRVFARLRPRVGMEQAQAEINGISTRLEKAYPKENAGIRPLVQSLEEKSVGKVRPLLLVLLGAVLFVLLIACANVANLALARAADRQREISIRRAIGASWPRILRQFLTESLLLAFAGGALGILLAVWATRALKLFVSDSAGQFSSLLPQIDRVQLDIPVLLFTAGVSLLSGILFGLAPALQALRPSLSDSLKEGGRSGSDSRSGNRVRRVLVALEVAVCFVLLAGAALLTRSFFNLRNIDPGFDATNLLTMTVSLAGQPQYTGARRVAYFRDAAEAVRTLPGIESASMVNHLPIGGDQWGFSVWAEGQPVPKPADTVGAVYRVSMPGYFRTMGIRLLRGRDFGESDNDAGARVVIVNEKLAKRFWPGEDPIGKRITLKDPTGQNVEWLRVVGLIGAVKQHFWAGEIDNEFYVPFYQDREAVNEGGPARSYLTLVAKTHGDPSAITEAVKSRIWSLNREVPLSDVGTMEQVIGYSLWQARLQTVILGAFAGFAILLAAIGLYGVIAYSVGRRTHEIGIRMALGATGGEVVRLILSEAVWLVLAGLAVGMAAALTLSRSLSSLLYGVGATDPLTFLLIPAALAAVGLLASYLPARRASGVDPASGLRCG
jgi:predicted permease